MKFEAATCDRLFLNFGLLVSSLDVPLWALLSLDHTLLNIHCSDALPVA